MKTILKTACLALPAFFTALLSAGCASTGTDSGDQRPSRTLDDSAEAASDRSTSLYERRLVDILRAEQRLDAYAQREDAEQSEAQRRFQSIARDYGVLIANNPDELEPRLLYGKLLNRYGDPLGALEQFHAALDIDPEVAVPYQQLSVVYAEEGEPGTALAYALEAVELDPDEPLYHFGIGELLTHFRAELIEQEIVAEDRIDEQMIEAYARAAELSPNSLDAQFRYGEAFYDMQHPDWDAAMAHWQSLDRLSGEMDGRKRDEWALHRARVLGELGRIEEALEVARSVSSPGLAGTRNVLVRQFESWIADPEGQ